MLDLNLLGEFSRNNCVGICIFLVPANLLATLLTIILAAINRPKIQVWRSAGVAGILASIMVLHVYTWFVIGVVMLPTYILLGLAVTCLIANFGAILWKLSVPGEAGKAGEERKICFPTLYPEES